MKNKSFTLIELLVVIVIIGVLAGVILVTTTSSVSNATLARAKAFSSNVQNSMLLNLVSEWTFDEGSNQTVNRNATNDDVKDTWGVNNGTVGGSPQIKGGSDCVYGKCLSFNGTSDYIDYVNDGSLNIINELTISVWIKPNNVNADFLRVVHKGDQSGTLRGYGIAQSSTNGKFVGFYQKNYSTVEFNKRTSVILQNGQWYNIVMTWNGVESSAGILMHVNGSECSEDTTTTDYGWSATGAGFNIGRKAGSAGYFFNGLIDDVRIYNKALSQARIKQNYIAGLNSLLSKGLISSEEYNSKISELGSK